MNKSDWVLVLSSAGLVAGAFLTVDLVAPEMADIVLRIGGRGQSLFSTVVKDLVSCLFVFVAGYPFSRILFGTSVGFYERVFTSILVSFITYSWVSLAGIFFMSGLGFFSVETEVMSAWFVLMVVIGYPIMFMRSGGEESD